MPLQEISYRPSRAKQTIFLAILLLVFIFCAAGFLLLWPVDPLEIQNIVGRTILFNLHGLLLVVTAVLAGFSAVCFPIVAVMMLLNRPVFTLTPEGIRLANGALVAWSEIDEIHEYVESGAPGIYQQVFIGLYLRDEQATAKKLGATGRWEMGTNKKHGWPPIALVTHHLQKSPAEILDDIERYLKQVEGDPLPEVFRRKD